MIFSKKSPGNLPEINRKSPRHLPELEIAWKFAGSMRSETRSPEKGYRLDSRLSLCETEFLCGSVCSVRLSIWPSQKISEQSGNFLDISGKFPDISRKFLECSRIFLELSKNFLDISKKFLKQSGQILRNLWENLSTFPNKCQKISLITLTSQKANIQRIKSKMIFYIRNHFS